MAQLHRALLTIIATICMVGTCVALNDYESYEAVMAPADTEIMPQHEDLIRVHSLVELSEFDAQREGLRLVHVYPGLYNDVSEVHLDNIWLVGTNEPDYVTGEWSAEENAVFETELWFHGEAGALVYAVVDVGNLSGSPTAVHYDIDCQAFRLANSIITNSSPQTISSTGVIAQPPRTTPQDDPYRIVYNRIENHVTGVVMGEGTNTDGDHTLFLGNRIFNNKTGLMIGLDAQPGMGDETLYPGVLYPGPGKNTFGFNAVNIIIERNASDIPLPITALGNQWLDVNGYPLVGCEAIYNSILVSNPGSRYLSGRLSSSQAYIDVGCEEAPPRVMLPQRETSRIRIKN